jgi:hypothetical protein
MLANLAALSFPKIFAKKVFGAITTEAADLVHTPTDHKIKRGIVERQSRDVGDLQSHQFVNASVCNPLFCGGKSDIREIYSGDMRARRRV